MAEGMLFDLLTEVESCHISNQSVCSLLELSISLDLRILKEKCMSFIARNLYLLESIAQGLKTSLDEEELTMVGFEQLSESLKVTLNLLQRTYRRYQRMNNIRVLDTSECISCREIISIIAECNEDDTERYVSALERLEQEVVAYRDALVKQNNIGLLIPLFEELKVVNLEQCGGHNLLSCGNNTSGELLSESMMLWRNRIVNVDVSLQRQRDHIKIQKGFYKEQKEALNVSHNLYA